MGENFDSDWNMRLLIKRVSYGYACNSSFCSVHANYIWRHLEYKWVHFVGIYVVWLYVVCTYYFSKESPTLHFHCPIQVITLTIVSIGVAVATVTDMQFNFFGACVALAWIVPSAINKILWSSLQQTGNWTALAYVEKLYNLICSPLLTVLLNQFPSDQVNVEDKPNYDILLCGFNAVARSSRCIIL